MSVTIRLVVYKNKFSTQFYVDRRTGILILGATSSFNFYTSPWGWTRQGPPKHWYLPQP